MDTPPDDVIASALASNPSQRSTLTGNMRRLVKLEQAPPTSSVGTAPICRWDGELHHDRPACLPSRTSKQLITCTRSGTRFEQQDGGRAALLSMILFQSKKTFLLYRHGNVRLCCCVWVICPVGGPASRLRSSSQLSLWIREQF